MIPKHASSFLSVDITDEIGTNTNASLSSHNGLSLETKDIYSLSRVA